MFGGNKIQELETENQRLATDLTNLSAWAEKYKILDAVQIQTANNELQTQQNALRDSIKSMQTELATLKASILETNDLVLLQEIGIYEFKH